MPRLSTTDAALCCAAACRRRFFAFRAMLMLSAANTRATDITSLLMPIFAAPMLCFTTFDMLVMLAASH